MSIVKKLVIYEKYSELHRTDIIETFKEGTMSTAAQERYQRIYTALKNGYLVNEIEKCFKHPEQLSEIKLLSDNHKEVIESIVSAVTGDVGRAVGGLSVLQCTVKAIAPDQSIRLHKGGRTTKKDFSWEEGISMRSLDNSFITPTLRAFNLLKLNKDGFMMTRTLAENYPYSKFYKAQIRGAKIKWLQLVDLLEEKNDGAFSKGCLQYLISKLINSAQQFESLANESENYTLELNQIDVNFSTVTEMMLNHWEITSYASRVMEISMHTFMQACEDMELLEEAELVILSQMRSANKKHKNIGDIELSHEGKIIEAWDAKYGKTYFYDELDELSDKLELHDNIKIAGFVSSGDPDIRDDIIQKIQSISEQFDTNIKILSFEQWLNYQIQEFKLSSEQANNLGELWLLAYTESLSLKRLERAPIDEPCYLWLESWHDLLKNYLTKLNK